MTVAATPSGTRDGKSGFATNCFNGYNLRFTLQQAGRNSQISEISIYKMRGTVTFYCNLGMGLAVVLTMCGVFSGTVCASLMSLKIHEKGKEA